MSTSLSRYLRDVEPGLMTTEPFVTCILDVSLFLIYSLLSVNVKFLLFCLGSLDKYPKIVFPKCKLNNSTDYSPLCIRNFSFKSQIFFTWFTRVNFCYHFLSFSNPFHTLNIVTYSKLTVLFSYHVSTAKIPTPDPETFRSTPPPPLKRSCLETVFGLSTYRLLELSRTLNTETLACHYVIRFMPVTVRKSKINQHASRMLQLFMHYRKVRRLFTGAPAALCVRRLRIRLPFQICKLQMRKTKSYY